MHKTLTTMLMATLVALTASCGGGQAVLSLNGQPDSGSQTSTGRLPGLPSEPGGKAISGAADTVVVPGSDVFVSENATVQDTTLVLQSTQDALAYGLYKVQGLADKKVTGFVIEMQPATLDTVYSVGVSNFSEGVWDFPVTSSLPEFEYSFTDEMERRTSALGSFYFVVVTANGNLATVLQTTVFSRALQAGEVEQPLFGGDIAASEGLADKVVVQWAAVAGATSYELWREVELEGQDEVAELLATLSAVDGQASYSYEDFAIQLGLEYKYRIRGLNEAGSGAFSRWVGGWAGSTAPVDGGNGGPDGEELELPGTIEVLSDTSITVAGTQFETDDATIWLDQNKDIASESDFAVGMNVEISGRANGAGGWIATSVEMGDNEPPVDELSLTGLIESLDASSISVGGYLFAVNLDTTWLDLNGLPAAPADFAVGDNVEITGVADGQGGWSATVIKKADTGAPGEINVSGAIEALSEVSITVNATSFAIVAATAWQDNLGGALTAADFAVGDLVEATGVDNGLGGWDAVLVKQQDAGGGAGDQETLGPIEAIDATSITVQGLLIATDAQTEYADLNHDQVDRSAFTEGMLVSVSYVDDGAGGWLAQRVRMED